MSHGRGVKGLLANKVRLGAPRLNVRARMSAMLMPKWANSRQRNWFWARRSWA